MPATKKKLGAIGLFLRQADGSVAAGGGGPQGGSTSSPRAGRRRSVGHAPPATPAPALPGPGPRSASATGQAQLRQPQPRHEIAANRQEGQLPDTPATSKPRSASKTRSSSRQAARSQPSASVSLPSHDPHPMQRSRTSASDPAREAPRGHNAWEDSTVASMFGDNESRAGSERLRAPQGGHGRHFSDVPPPQRALPRPPSRAQHTKHDDSLPFVIGENGMLKVVSPSGGQKAPETAPAPLAFGATTAGDIFDEQSIMQDDPYDEGRPTFETPTKTNGLRRAKLPYRENREVRGNASPERAGPGHPLETQTVSLSPERDTETVGHIDKIRLQERLARERKREREREWEREREREREREKERLREQERNVQNQQQPDPFESPTPIDFDDPDFNDTKAAIVASSSAIDADALQEALERTPRANRQAPKQLPAPLNHNDILGEGPPPLGRAASRRQKSPTKELAPNAAPTTTSRKRRQSLDYNDAELHAMSYSDLRNQDFDFDPQTAALQQPSLPPTGGSIQERLEHYKSKGSVDQHQFFTRISLEEWDEAGDWFLEQFGSIMQRLREARKAKRRLVQQYEDEIAAREEAVRGKIENIGRTLEELRKDGQTMMQGKDVDMEL
ncbi:hypothetical protein VTH06DRAFT_4111 [Thermothelomyces fergusii]